MNFLKKLSKRELRQRIYDTQKAIAGLSPGHSLRSFLAIRLDLAQKEIDGRG